mmetsp:Transcript_5804/g.6643  ORF Transcript_5804/g.6643 Transcript_5804/m.6643 type:complete len:243 (-) Transcript_5804:79-807(-)
MAALLDFVRDQSSQSVRRRGYLDKQRFSSLEEQDAAKNVSRTVYVGNLSFYTSESQVYSLFSHAGSVQRVVMGLHRVNRTPCGFCFVIFDSRYSVESAAKFLNGCVLDGQELKVEIDPGFEEGRQYGRARSGGQVQDELRAQYNANRGGFGAGVSSESRHGSGYYGKGNRRQNYYRDGYDERRKRRRHQSFDGDRRRQQHRNSDSYRYSDSRNNDRHSKRESDKVEDTPNPRWRRNGSDDES